VCAGIGLAMSAATSASMAELPAAMAGVGSAVNDTTRNMGSVLGVAVFGSISASVFASRIAGLTGGHGSVGSLGSVGATTAVARHAGGAYGASVLHAAASAFVTGADRAVLAGAIATLAGAVIAFRTLRDRRPAAVHGAVPKPAEVVKLAGIPELAEIPEPAGAARG
jgi:hypothetical protein